MVAVVASSLTSSPAVPCGSWRSPISSALAAHRATRLGQLAVDGQITYWTETRPSRGGRDVLVRRDPDGSIAEVLPPSFSVRTRVHEEGGGAFVVANGTVYFSNDADGRLYQQRNGAPQPITPPGAFRYADGVLNRRTGQLICVREDHTAAGDPVNTIVGIDLSGRRGAQVLASGNDFYSSPRLSPDGSRLAWLSWNHPDMPWTSTELWLAGVSTEGSLREPVRVAGASGESIFQPEWSPDGILHFVSDRTGWWNLYRLISRTIEPVLQLHADLGRAQWHLGMSTYAFESRRRLVGVAIQNGRDSLYTLDLDRGSTQKLETSLTAIRQIRVVPGSILFIGGSPTEAESVLRFDLRTRTLSVLRHSVKLMADDRFVSIPQSITFPSGDAIAYGFLYPPRNPTSRLPPGEKPPLIVRAHGGPTGAAAMVLDVSVQFWTSRGFAVIDVNYAGSTGYGRPYRERLYGLWGEREVEDCISAARFLAEQGAVDSRRMAITGASAGGYTCLRALTLSRCFAAGTSRAGVADLETLAHELHKFESRYLDWLVGPYPGCRDLYQARSPARAAGKISSPVMLVQGADDPVVPRNQAEIMVAALRAAGVPVAFLLFPDEGHGLRRAENIQRSLDAELYFYSRVLGFEPADVVEPIPIS